MMIMVMLTYVMNFLKGPLGKISLVIGIVLASIFGFQWWLSHHDDIVQQNALTGFNLQQAEDARARKADYDKRMAAALADQNVLLSTVQADRDQLEQQRLRLINTIQVGGLSGGASSEVLKGTIRLLQDRQKGSK